MGHWRQPVLLFILPKKPQEMNDFSSFLAVFFYGLMSQSLFVLAIELFNFFNRSGSPIHDVAEMDIAIVQIQEN